MITFFVEGRPVSQPRPRSMIMWPAKAKLPRGKSALDLFKWVKEQTNIHVYGDAKTEPIWAWRSAVALAGRVACDEPFDCAVQLTVLFGFPRPIAQTRRFDNPPIWKETLPDLDNLEKAVLDALNGIAFVDDRKVSNVHKIKFLVGDGQLPGCYVEVSACRGIVPIALYGYPTDGKCNPQVSLF